ncbi:MAG: hypothetical protein V5A88_00515 [Candidatus Thermoplasmatota archaeon]
MSAELDEEELLELSDEGLSLKEIADELDKPVGKIRDIISGNPNMSERLKKMALESKAFEMFEEGEEPKELVKSGFCAADKAETLYQKYSELGKEEKERSMEDKLATQIGLLGSRLARLEIKIQDSTLLPKTFECPSCGHEGEFAVALVCKRCENVNIHDPNPHPKIMSNSRPLLDHLTTDSEEDENEEE